MNIIAFILAVLAIIVFVAAAYGVARRWAHLGVGLALTVAAWVVQSTWVTEHVLRVTGN